MPSARVRACWISPAKAMTRAWARNCSTKSPPARAAKRADHVAEARARGLWPEALLVERRAVPPSPSRLFQARGAVAVGGMMYEQPDPLAPAFAGAAFGASLFVIYGGLALTSAVLGAKIPLVAMVQEKNLSLWRSMGIGAGVSSSSRSLDLSRVSGDSGRLRVARCFKTGVVVWYGPGTARLSGVLKQLRASETHRRSKTETATPASPSPKRRGHHSHKPTTLNPKSRTPNPIPSSHRMRGI